MKPVVWISEGSQRACAGLLSGKLVRDPIVTSTLAEFLAAGCDPDAVCFVDDAMFELCAQINHIALPHKIVVISREPLNTTVKWLQANSWLSHVISASMLEQPMAESHFANVIRTLPAAEPRLLDWLGAEVDGRRVRLTHASKRAERLERMSQFFDEKGMGTRTTQLLCDTAEELLTNAFYDAPVTAGLTEPISRTRDVELPDKHACDLAYGCREDLAIVRVRDPFGSLPRRRLVEVLVRCAQPDGTVNVDESMGGAGLGMWRIFSSATFAAVSVVGGIHTEILVAIAKKAPRPRPYAFHLFFSEGRKRKRFWKLFRDDTGTEPPINKSIMLEFKDIE